MKTFNSKEITCGLVLLLAVFLSTNFAHAQAFLKSGTVVFDVSTNINFRSGTFQSVPQFYLGGGFDVTILEHLDLEIGANIYKSKINGIDGNPVGILNSWMLGLPIILKIPVVKNLKTGLGATPSLFLNPERRAQIFFQKSNISGTIHLDFMPVKHIHLELGYNIGLIPKKFFIIENGKEVVDPNFQSFYTLGVKYGF